MPWSETTRMDERRRFIELLESCRLTMTELCDSFGIARKTGYKWAERYVDAVLEGLEDRSRAPKRCPHATEGRCIEALVEERRRHPRLAPLWRSWVAPLGRSLRLATADMITFARFLVVSAEYDAELSLLSAWGPMRSAPPAIGSDESGNFRDPRASQSERRG